MGIRRLEIFLGGVEAVGIMGAVGCEPHGQEMGGVGVMGAVGVMGVMGGVGAVRVVGRWEPHGQGISEGLGEALRFRYKYNCLSCYDYSLFSMVL